MGSFEPERVEAIAEFDIPPRVDNVLSEAVSSMVRKGVPVRSNADIILYRGGPDGVIEAGRSSQIPPLQWGDVLVLTGSGGALWTKEPGPGEFTSYSSRELPRTPRRVSIHLGDRTSEVRLKLMAEPWWAPTTKLLPSWGFSELVSSKRSRVQT